MDADGDGRTDVVAATGGANDGRVAVFAAPTLIPPNPLGVRWFDPLPGLATGVFVG